MGMGWEGSARPSAPTIYICRVCNRVLDTHTRWPTESASAGTTPTSTEASGVTLEHTLQDALVADHEPDPIPMPAGYAGGRCDFCNTDSVEYELPVRDFTLPWDHATTSGGDWSACAECAALIERNSWNSLINRVVVLNAGKSYVDKESIRRMYRQVRANVIGSLRPITRA